MLSLFGFGLLLGMQHALEADHIAALASLASDETSAKQSMKHGATWGVGHAFTLLLFGGIVLIFGLQLSAQFAHWLEFAVGGMLIALGARVLYCLWQERIHIHPHNHNGGVVHIHAHSHKHVDEDSTGESRHKHVHRQISARSYIQTLGVGIMHGMAGTAALMVLVATTSVNSIYQAIGYIVIFGIGSVLGMAVLSLVMVVPTSYLVRSLPSLFNFMRLSVGTGTFVLGGYVLMINWPY